MENCFEREYLVLPEDADGEGQLRLSRLLSLLENISSAHYAAGEGSSSPLSDCGWGWIVTRYDLKISDLPKAGEVICIRTQTGESRFGLYARYYELVGQEQRTAVSGWGSWSVLDLQRRTIVMPSQSGITHPPTALKSRFSPRLRRQLTPCGSFSFTVPEHYIDKNGHMNNACYAEAVTAHFPLAGKHLTSFQMEYHAEVRAGETVCVDWEQEDDAVLLRGIRENDLCFLMKLQYKSTDCEE